VESAPYVTAANSSITLDGSNNIIGAATVSSAQGHIGEAKLRERASKGFLWRQIAGCRGRIQQSRSDIRSRMIATAGAVSHHRAKAEKAKVGADSPICSFRLIGRRKQEYVVDGTFKS